jgi:hypothetical protein
MFFTECVSLTERHPNLAAAIQKIDAQFRKMRTAEVIRAGDMASLLGLDPNQVSAVLEWLAKDRVLRTEEMVECAYCGMAVLQSDYYAALEEDDEYRCTSCDRPWEDRRAQAITTYRSGEKWPEPPPYPTTELLIEPGDGLPKAHCRIITHDGVKELGKDQYDGLVSERKTYGIFIDGFTRAVLRKGKARPKLTPAEFAIMCDYIESKAVMRPLGTKSGGGRSREAANKLFANARNKVDTSLGRYEYLVFRTHKATVPAMKSFQFDPPKDLTYCLIIPNTR